MANKTRINENLNDEDLEKGAKSIADYLTGKYQTPETKMANEAFLNSLPQDKISELKSLSARANNQGPRGEGAMGFSMQMVVYERDKGRAELLGALRTLTDNDPVLKDKLLDVADTRNPKKVIFAFAPTEMPVQQQQAYLKVLGHDIGKAGLDGIAGKNSQTQKALDEFAKNNGIDPKDTAKVNRALYSAAIESQTIPSLVARQKDIESGKASPDDIKTIQWLMSGRGSKMPLSLHGNKMDGVAGAETNKELESFAFSLKMGRDAWPAGTSQKTKVADIQPDSPLQKFTDSLTPEQRDIQKKIAALGGVISYGEPMGMSPEMARRVAREDQVARNIYEGGFPQDRSVKKAYPYTPSKEVDQLKAEFEKSLTPEQKIFRQEYEDIGAKKETDLIRVFTDPKLREQSVKDFVGQKRLSLFRDNASDILQDIQKAIDDSQPNITAKFTQKEPNNKDASYNDLRKMLGISSPMIDVSGFDMHGSFDKAAQGNPMSVTVGMDDVGVKRNMQTPSASLPAMEGAKP